MAASSEGRPSPGGVYRESRWWLGYRWFVLSSVALMTGLSVATDLIGENRGLLGATFIFVLLFLVHDGFRSLSWVKLTKEGIDGRTLLGRRRVLSWSDVSAVKTKTSRGQDGTSQSLIVVPFHGRAIWLPDSLNDFQRLVSTVTKNTPHAAHVPWTAWWE